MYSQPVQDRYKRDSDQGGLTLLQGVPTDFAENRLAQTWRPIIDLGRAPLAPIRLQMATTVNDWLADGREEWPWFSMIAPSGIRRHVVLHAGLAAYDCSEPAGLAPELRTPEWQLLVDLVERFGELSYQRRSLVLFQLAQLSFLSTAIRCVGAIENGESPDQDRFAMVAARIVSAYPRGSQVSVPVFEALAQKSDDPSVALLGCFQAIGHSLRSRVPVGDPDAMERRGRELERSTDHDWLFTLMRSRFHRALALYRIRSSQAHELVAELQESKTLGDEVIRSATNGTEQALAKENRRIIVESMIKAAAASEAFQRQVDVEALCAQLLEDDANCVYARLVAGDGYVSIGRHEEAAKWYERAGELGTSGGAMGWFRAAQCHERLSDDWAATNAMGRCLELDSAVVEAKQRLARVV